jgi:hypothetical protein
MNCEVATAVELGCPNKTVATLKADGNVSASVKKRTLLSIETSN